MDRSLNNLKEFFMADNYYIQKGSYLQFDATTIEQYIKDQLEANGSKFTDQNFEGSYFSSVIEVISYTFNVLMFYLNQTSSESMFTDAQLYENMNRIVKMLGYNPVGYQTSLVPYTASTTDLDSTTVYNIPRYSYINAGGTTYSFNEDIIFKGNNIDDVVDEKVLYQGKFYEYPLYSAEGGGNEIIYLTPGDDVIVDHFNINVYVKDKTGSWSEWEQIESLSLAGASSEVFEARYNENGNYELSFGNNVNGKELTIGDSIAIYYLQSDGDGNELSVGDLQDVRYVQFSSTQFTEIYEDVSDSLNVGTIAPASSVSFDNEFPSTSYSEPETVDEMREYVPMVVKEKNTLTRTDDYERHITRNFSNIVSDVTVVDNWEYTATYLKYFYNLGIDDIQNVSRILYNQIKFADSCNFNNIYMFVKPTITSTGDYNAFLSPSLKQLIINNMESIKSTTTEPIVCDPVYMAIDIGINDLTTDITYDDADSSELVIIKDSTSLRSDDAIITDVNDIFLDYFDQDVTTFGMEVSFSDLNDSILGVDGVVDFKVSRTDDDSVYYSGLSMITWNPVYTEDVDLLLRSKTYDFFQVPYLNNRDDFIDKIRVETED